MKKLVLGFALVIGMIGNAQTGIKVTISKRSMFGFEGQDSLHLMIKNTYALPIDQIYEPIDLVLELKFKQRKLYYIKDGKYVDTAIIKNYFVQDSIYNITLTEKHMHFEDRYIDTKLIIDTRKNPIDKKLPKVCYYWYWDHWNDSRGHVTDYALIEKIK